MMRKAFSTILVAALLLGPAPGMAVAAAAQVRTIDPNQAIDADLSRPQVRTPAAPQVPATPPAYPEYTPAVDRTAPAQPPADPAADPQQQTARAGANAVAASSQTFSRPELLAAAEGVFGKGTAGLAGMLEKVLKDQGEPNAYIAGREASAAFVVGLRYGKGELFHKIEGQQPTYWTGPSAGFDVGGDASKVFVLVYNLYDTEELYKGRFLAGEGRLFFIGGLAATYLRKGDKVVIPIRLGVGWRQGVNVGYMKFSHKSKWFPF